MTLGRSLLLFGAALVPRLYTALAWAREPVWDGHYYDIGARSIAQGRGYVGVDGDPWCHYPVGYSALLGGVYRLFGDGQFVGPLLNAVLGALLTAAAYLVARREAGEKRALIAGILVACYPGFIAYTPVLMTEPTAMFLLLASAAVAARRTWPSLLAAAVVMGLAVLVRPQSLLCAPALALFLPKDVLSWKRWGGAALAAALSIAVVVPWSLRNCEVMDGCAFVSTNAGWNLAIGASPRANGRFVTLRASDGCRIVSGQVQQDRCWLELGAGWIRERPRRWLTLIPLKLGHTFDHESFAIGYLGEADPETWPESKKAVGRAIVSWTHRLLLVVAAAALLPRPRRARPLTLLGLLGVLLLAFYAATTPGQPFWLVALAALGIGGLRWWSLTAPLRFALAVLASVVVTHAVFFGEDRYHLVVTPWLCVIAATGWLDTRSSTTRRLAEGNS